MAAMSASPILRLISTWCTCRTYRLIAGIPWLPSRRCRPVGPTEARLERRPEAPHRAGPQDRRSSRRRLPGHRDRAVRACPPQSVRTARGDDPVGPAHRRACQPRDAGVVRPLSHAAGSCRRRPGRARGADPVYGILPLEGRSPPRSFRGDRDASWRRGAPNDGGADRAPRRRSQDGERRALGRLRTSRAAGRHPRDEIEPAAAT